MSKRETVGIRELKDSASRIIERAEKGEPITVTRRGKPVARIVSATIPPHLARLIAEGAVAQGTGAPYLPRPIELREAGKTAAEYVSEGRR